MQLSPDITDFALACEPVTLSSKTQPEGASQGRIVKRIGPEPMADLRIAESGQSRSSIPR